MIDLTCVAPTVTEILGLPRPREAEGEAVVQIVEQMKPCPRLAVVVLDGLGMATWENSKANTPVINEIARQNLVQLRSVSPTITPVCFATIATGAKPTTHGVREHDGQFCAETIFEVARQNGRTSGVAGGATCSATRVLGRWSEIIRRVGSDGKQKDDLILAAGLRVVEEERPDLFFTQFVEVDSTSHKYGPFSPEAVAATAALDRRFGRLFEGLRDNGYGVLALADHGQHTIDPPVDGCRGWHDDSTEESMVVPMMWVKAIVNCDL